MCPTQPAEQLPIKLLPLTARGGSVTSWGQNSWRLALPAAVSPVSYQLAQLDDYHDRLRHALPWQPPLCLSLRARVSSSVLPGTWGFGLWNDPFSLKLGLGSTARIPDLPNAAWFFCASSENHLAFYDHLPGAGFLTATFNSRRLPAWLRAVAAPGLAALIWPPLASTVRRFSRRFITQDAANLELKLTEWHAYSLQWRPDQVIFTVDGQEVFSTRCSPCPPLGLVIWIDNQFAAWLPGGRPRLWDCTPSN